ncbi:MAG TPA: cell envelope integrity protein TolA [Burkholderiales bacterium]|nr:cell envelope integrity protein TolA [Burkholderiales bacterium]
MSFRANSEPGKLPAGVLAVLVHLAFFALLVFGVTWRTQSPAPVMVELWNNAPSPIKEAPVEPPPQPKQEAPSRPPEPEPRPEPKPQPKPESQPIPKPDIALKEKEAKKKKLEEEMRQQELERKKLQERKKEEERLAEAVREKQEKLKEEQAKKLAEQKQAQARALAQAKADQAASAAADAKVGDYIAKIQAKIRSNTVIPPDVAGNPEVVYEITLLPTGEILDMRRVKSSGLPSYDAATERAIRKSAPLPIPKDDPTLFASKFRSGNYSFRPND